jgi:hypothetical protein
MTSRSLLASKALIFILLCLLLQFALARWWLPNELALLDRYLAEKAEIIFFGDSTLYPMMSADADVHCTPLILEEILNARVGIVARAAYGPRLYAAYLHYVARHASRPKTVIIPLNLRAFTPGWRLNPGWSFIQERTAARSLLGEILWRPMASFKLLRPDATGFVPAPAFQRPTETTSMSPPSHSDRVDGVNDFTIEEYEAAWRHHYAAEPPTFEADLNDLADACAAAARRGITVIFYLHPVNHQLMEERLGREAVETVRARAKRLTDQLQASGIQPIDLTLALDSGTFAWRLSPLDDHLTGRGRNLIAQRLATVFQVLRGTPLGPKQSFLH